MRSRRRPWRNVTLHSSTERCRVISMILRMLAPVSAAEVAKPARRLWPLGLGGADVPGAPETAAAISEINSLTLPGTTN